MNEETEKEELFVMGYGCNSILEHLPSMHKSLGSILAPPKNRILKKKLCHKSPPFGVFHTESEAHPCTSSSLQTPTGWSILTEVDNVKQDG